MNPAKTYNRRAFSSVVSSNRHFLAEERIRSWNLLPNLLKVLYFVSSNLLFLFLPPKFRKMKTLYKRGVLVLPFS